RKLCAWQRLPPLNADKAAAMPTPKPALWRLARGLSVRQLGATEARLNGNGPSRSRARLTASLPGHARRDDAFEGPPGGNRVARWTRLDDQRVGVEVADEPDFQEPNAGTEGAISRNRAGQPDRRPQGER